MSPLHTCTLLFLALAGALGTEISFDGNLGGDPQMTLGEGGGAKRSLCPRHSKVWGPGLDPAFHMPVRYFYIQAVDSTGQNFTVSVGNKFKLDVRKDGGQHAVRAWTEIIDRADGVYLARFRLFEEVDDLEVEVRLDNGAQVAGSPYRLQGPIYHESCGCAEREPAVWTERMECKGNYTQIDLDMESFPDISVVDLERQIHRKFDTHYNLGHYVILNNKVYSREIGEHSGLNVKFETILHSLMAKVNLPDMEFFVNFRDKPIVKSTKLPIPIFSFGGSRDTADIALPSYELTENMMRSLHKAELDLQKLQGKIGPEWPDKVPIAFWRGRDSREQRLDLCRLSKSYPDKIDAKLTQSLFFSHVPSMYGDLAPRVPFEDFFEYKYQLSLDGMAAATRVPYVMAGPAVLFKQDSFFYEHFYADIEPWVHYIPFNHNLNNLIQRLNWAGENDHLAHIISENGRHFVRTSLRPTDLYCYYYRLFSRYAEKQYGKIEVRKGMHELRGKRVCQKCPYNPLNKAEL